MKPTRIGKPYTVTDHGKTVTRVILTHRYEAAAFDFFMWELTPWPVGQPTWMQIAYGYRWALKLPWQTFKHPEE